MPACSVVMRLLGTTLAMMATSAVTDAKPPPTVVTQAWMRDLHARGWPVDELIDNQRGLLVLEHVVQAPVDDFKGRVAANKYCGAALEKVLPTLRARLRAEYKAADTFSCHNKPTIGCEFTFAHTYTTLIGLRFEKARDDTLRLSVVTFLDGGGIGDREADQQARWVTRQLSESGGSCEGSE